MASHQVQQGETLITIAHQYGFRDWKAIWEDTSNAGLRKTRPDPMVLKAGDQLNIPERKPAEFRLETNRSHTLQLKPLKAHLRLLLRNASNEPMAQKRFKLEQDGTVHGEGKTDERGFLEAEVPPEAHGADMSLTVWPTDGDEKIQWTLHLGHLEPVTEEAGVRSRLNNLGYAAGAEGEGEALKSALSSFQSEHGLPASGQVDEPTRKKLLEAYGM